jgi:hypothetical protein
MGHAGSQQERRSSHRVDLDGRAVLFQRGDRVGQYTLQNISAGGAMVNGDRELRPGHLVHLLIDLASGEQTMSFTGSVRRSRKGNGSDGVGLAISFPILSADQEDAIHNAVLRSLLRRDARTRQLPILVFEPRRRVREEIESEIRSFGLCAYGVDALTDAVRELEGEENQYAALVIHSAAHDARAMEVVEFFTRREDLRTIILPDPDGALSEQAERLASLPEVRVPRIWSRAELRDALSH